MYYKFSDLGELLAFKTSILMILLLVSYCLEYFGVLKEWKSHDEKEIEEFWISVMVFSLMNLWLFALFAGLYYQSSRYD